MISVDLLRALITLTPVFLFYLNRPSFPALVVSSVLLSGLGAFFEPALQGVLPLAAKDTTTLKAANGLMSTTLRLARVMGPAIIGLLSALIETIHFFTLNSLSYLFSAFSVFSIRESISTASIRHSSENKHLLTSFLSSFKLLRTRPSVLRTLFAKTITGGAWGLVYGLGMALLVHEISPKDVKAFGLVMGAYGIGNVFAAILIGNLERKNPERMVYFGLSWLGICFAFVAGAKSFPLLLFATALTAIGGPLNDLPFMDLVQAEFGLKDLSKIFRLRMIAETFFSLLFMLISPLLFRFFPIRSVIFGCGIFILAFGVLGLFNDLNSQSRPHSDPSN